MGAESSLKVGLRLSEWPLTSAYRWLAKFFKTLNMR